MLGQRGFCGTGVSCQIRCWCRELALSATKEEKVAQATLRAKIAGVFEAPSRPAALLRAIELDRANAIALLEVIGESSWAEPAKSSSLESIKMALDQIAQRLPARKRNPTGYRHLLGRSRSSKAILDGTWKPPVVKIAN